ncbi:MAG: FAD/NAD(P)-binding protein [Ardenticatenaceae bacterium]|nr:FAD/NAD(P)-binding protein [Ardenticatenaceae bacterium]MCB8949388.1 FAD/NAD(P)-binding protein [Ardenticatenaceae bacterium]
MKTLLREVRESPSIYMPVPARITAVRTLTELEKLYTIELPYGLTLDHDPGQFVQVSLFGVGEAPISVCSSPSRSNGTFELCVRNVGDLTSKMHELTVDDTLGIRGPFGRGFPMERYRGKDVVFIAGGLGLAPLRSVIYEAIDHREKYNRIVILYGARSPKEMLFRDEVNAFNWMDDVEMYTTVDCGDEKWHGEVGFVNCLLNKVALNPHNTVSIVCGPPVMYKFIIDDLTKMGVAEHDIWLSFERHMKCGVGKCGHCQINHIYACLDGPSLSYTEIKNLEEAL